MNQSEYIDALKQVLSDYDTLFAHIINALAPHLETLHQRCETLLHAEIDEDETEPWTVDQLNHLARQYNAIANTHNEQPVIITASEALKRLREMGLVQQ